MKALEVTMPYHHPENEIIGAGVLPFAVHGGQAHVLLGKETADNKFGVFGGRMKPGLGVVQSAVAEFHEETLGVIMPPEAMATLLDNRCYELMFKTATGPHKFFVTYMLQIPFDPSLPKRFRDIRSSLCDGDVVVPGSIGPDGDVLYDFLEKNELAWFPLGDILDAATNARWNHPVRAMHGTPTFRRPFLAGLHAVMQYIDIRRIFLDVVWCHDNSQPRQRRL